MTQSLQDIVWWKLLSKFADGWVRNLLLLIDS